MPPLFAWYYAKGLLHEAGWPRKLGMFKGEGYSALMVDEALAQAITWGASLGARCPSLALQMITEMYDDQDWEGEDAPDMKTYVEHLRETAWESAASPEEAVPLPQFTEIFEGKSLTVEQFDSREFRRTMEQLLLGALLWGLDHPDRFGAWYSAHKAEFDAMVPQVRSSGLEVYELPSESEFVENSEQLVRTYEQVAAREPLPPVASRLLADAEALGWHV